VAVVGLVSTVAMNFNVLIPALARDVLDVGATGYGFLMAASGIGALTAALAIAVIGRPGPRLLVGGALLLGLAEMAVAVSRVFPLSMGLMFLAGLGSIAMAATANTLIQLAVPDRLRGRVMSVYTTVFAGSTPIGGLMAGGIASAMGAPASLLVGGAFAVVVALGGVVSIRSLTDKDVRPAGPSAGRQVVKVTSGS
jgi:MFS family permease